MITLKTPQKSNPIVNEAFAPAFVRHNAITKLFSYITKWQVQGLVIHHLIFPEIKSYNFASVYALWKCLNHVNFSYCQILTAVRLIQYHSCSAKPIHPPHPHPRPALIAPLRCDDYGTGLFFRECLWEMV